MGREHLGQGLPYSREFHLLLRLDPVLLKSRNDRGVSLGASVADDPYQDEEQAAQPLRLRIGEYRACDVVQEIAIGYELVRPLLVSGGRRD